VSGLAAAGNSLFVENGLNGTIMEYATSGELVNASLITGMGGPLVCDGNGHLFVLNGDTIGEYTTSDETVNGSLITVTGLAGLGNIMVVPEPSSVVLTVLGLGALCLGLLRSRRAVAGGQSWPRFARQARVTRQTDCPRPSVVDGWLIRLHPALRD
jgi:hypothetical protein